MCAYKRVDPAFLIRGFILGIEVGGGGGGVRFAHFISFFIGYLKMGDREGGSSQLPLDPPLLIRACMPIKLNRVYKKID